MRSISAIRDFIESCRDNKYNEIHYPSVAWIKPDVILKNIVAFKHDFRYADHHDVLINFFKIVNVKTAELLVNHRYHEALQICDNFNTIEFYLIEQGLISYLDHFIFKSKWIQCLSHKGIILESILKTKDVFSAFENKKEEIKKYITDAQDKRENVYFMDYSDFLSFLKSLSKHVKKACYQNNSQKFAGYFHIQAKELEYEQLKLGAIENFPSDEFIIKPDIPRYGHTSGVIYTKGQYKGFKAVRYGANRFLKIACNRFGKWLWDYGESIPKLIRASVLSLGIYTIALHFKILNIVDSSTSLRINGILNHIYSNIVTFTSLGYGDFRPQDTFSRLCFSIEAILGLLFISLCIFMIGKKSIN